MKTRRGFVKYRYSRLFILTDRINRTHPVMKIRASHGIRSSSTNIRRFSKQHSRSGSLNSYYKQKNQYSSIVTIKRRY